MLLVFGAAFRACVGGDADPDVAKAQGTAAADRSTDVSFTVEITDCPQCFVPGHKNVVKYQISPGSYTAPFGRFQIFKRDGQGDPVGDPVYSTSTFNKLGGREWEFVYSGTEVNYQDEDYLVKISVGQDEQSASSVSEQIEVVGFDLYYFFWDVLDNGYASGTDIGTVNNSKVSVACWYYDQIEDQAGSISMCDIAKVEDMDDQLAADLGIDKDWYTERGGVSTRFSTFYAMSESDQHFYLRITVASDGVMDNAANPYDADPSTDDVEATVRYKMKIDPNGQLSTLETTYE